MYNKSKTRNRGKEQAQIIRAREREVQDQRFLVLYTDSILGCLPGGPPRNENDFGGEPIGEENMSGFLALEDEALEELALEDVVVEKVGCDDVNNEVEDCEEVSAL